MSGICGVRAFSAEAFAPDALREMAKTLHHRGPDGSSVWVGPDVGLAHTHLAITDVKHSHQPMLSVDGRWVIALDGVIVNRESLRVRLDYLFRTRGDAEVVVAGLTREGISFVERLHGQFALVAHDLRTATTHLVRDRLGILPLHYRHIPGGIAFGSEIKALLTVGPAPQVDHHSLDAYLGSQVVPAPDTLFEGVKQVRPAHRVSIMSRGHLEESHYWAPPECDPEGVWSAGDAIEAVGDGVREAVRAALAADVPVGAHLSGGVDSSLVVARMQQLRGDESVHTFSSTFDEHPGDESAWIRRISSMLGTEHHEVPLRAADFEDLWSRLTWHRDAPVTEPADVAAYAVARAAREHVQVVLSADGGDELFAPHRQHRLARFAQRSAALPSLLRSRLATPLERRVGATFTAAERQRLLGSPAPPERQSMPSLGVDPVERKLRHDLSHWLPDHVLARGDRMSMAASLELRPVLLDHRLVELVLRLPTSVKVRGGSTQWVLKEAARALLPDEVIDHKVGTRVPLDAWFRTGLRNTARDRLIGSDSWVSQSLDRALVRDLVERHERGGFEGPRLWALLGVEMWHDCFFGTAPAVPSPRQGSRPVAAPGRHL